MDLDLLHELSLASEAVEAGQIAPGIAYELSKVEDPAEQSRVRDDQ